PTVSTCQSRAIRTVTASSASFAPGWSTIAFSASSDTVTYALPVGSSTSLTQRTSTPLSRRLSRPERPAASVPTHATRTVGAPGRGAAPAWFAPLPPGRSVLDRATTVSPGCGAAPTRSTTSALTEPTTTTRPVIG